MQGQSQEITHTVSRIEKSISHGASIYDQIGMMKGSVTAHCPGACTDV